MIPGSGGASQSPRVAVVVLNWNGWHDTIQCLETVLRLRYDNLRVVVCDNGSTDGSIERIRDWARGRLSAEMPPSPTLRLLVDPPIPKPITVDIRSTDEAQSEIGIDQAPLILIQNATNAGFAGGTNVGLRYVQSHRDCRLVWIVNNDILVAPDSLRFLVDRLCSSPEIGAVSPTLFEYGSPDIVQIAGGGTFNPWLGFPRVATTTSARELDYLAGGCLLMRTETLDTIGLIDESYFLYGEDVDFSLRMRAAGLRMMTVPESHVWHKGGAAIGPKSPRQDYYTVRNNLFLVKRYFPRMMPIALGYAVYRCVLPKIVRGQWERLRAVRRGIADFRRGVVGRMSETTVSGH